MSSLTANEFMAIAEIIQERSGLRLTMDKLYLMETRLTPFARRRGMPSYESLIREVLLNPNDSLLTEIVEAMMTNETFFFRDGSPFEAFGQKILPFLKTHKKNSQQIRIWCAACSTGQEPYSLAMMFAENAHEWKDWSIEILATDISSIPLSRAKQGLYTQFEVQRGLPINLLIKYFTQIQDSWQISDTIKKMVTIRQFNLLDSLSVLGNFDIIFCRNVLIYFDIETKLNVLEALSQQLEPQGIVVLGSAETVLGITSKLQPSKDMRGFYTSPGSAVSSAIAASAA